MFGFVSFFGKTRVGNLSYMRIVESAADANHPAGTDEVAFGASVTSNVPRLRATAYVHSADKTA